MISQFEEFAISIARREAVQLDRTIYVMHQVNGEFGTFDSVGKDYVKGMVVCIARPDGSIKHESRSVEAA